MHLASALLLLPLIQDAPPLLPGTPDDWRGERLDFPLSFAPDLDLAGHEELRFAPGMFTAGAPDYWSYLFGVHLEQDRRVDEAFLQDFLERYYGGLCRAVGAGRGLDLADMDLAVEVEHSAGRFLARIEMVDAFVTGEPLSLALELDVSPSARHTDLFAIASPAAGDAPIWGQLRGMRDAWSAARPDACLLNHVYFVVEPETYAALTGSSWLRESFAPNEERTTVRRDMTYTGWYVYGAHTYFEFLPAGVAPQLPDGGTGLALGFEAEGATARAAERLKQVGIQTFGVPVTRQLDDQQLPWFEMLGVQAPHERSRLSLFTLEYEPRFLERWHPQLAPRPGRGLARRDVLTRYAAHLGQAPGVLRDVTAVHLALDEQESTRLTEVLRSLGWSVSEAGGRRHLDGPQVDLFVTPSEEPGGITGLDFSLRTPLEREPLELGALRLAFDGERASLRLR